jgi:hypothetical protein
MKKVALVMVLLGLLAPAFGLAEVGRPLEDLKNSSFFRFFNVSEVRRVDAPRGRTVVQWETGGFKEHIRLSGVLGDKGRLLSATLLVSRKWIGAPGNINPFAKDIVKSFIDQFVPRADRAQASPLVERIWGDTPKDASTAPASSPAAGTALPGWEVFVGARRTSRDSYATSHLDLANVDIRGEPWLMVWVYENGFELQGAAQAEDAPVPADVFLGVGEMGPVGLKLTQDSPKLNMKVWSSTDPKASINRVVDIRWVFATADETRRFHLSHLRENSENAQEIPLGDMSSFGQELRVFRTGTGDPLVKALGLKMNMYFFLFQEQTILAKVFVSGTDQLTLAEASRVARKADDVIKKALAAR